MVSDMSSMFSRMIGTLAVILVIAAYFGSSEIASKIIKTESSKWKYTLIMGLVGGIFGIYGNISGFDLGGAVISVRDIGPMLSGFTAGPASGLLAGLIAGVHRLTMGGITAKACVVATCCIGVICGFVSGKWRHVVERPRYALVLSVLMEVFHLSMVLLMVRPFATAVDIVRQIAVPFIAVNAVGFVLLIGIMTYTKKQRGLALERNRLQSELAVANVIQHSLLPPINERYPGRRELDVSAFMEAAKEVGGDFYDVFPVGPDRLAFVIGDVSGKGVPAALFMASAKTILQNCIRDIPDLSQAIATANNVLCARNEAEMFVTVWVGILDLVTGELRFVSAGHNPPVLLRENRGELLRCKNGFVLAGMESMKYRENTVQLRRGDSVCLYTDGVTEAEDRSHALFGEDRLLRCFENKSGRPSAEIIGTVKHAIDEFICGNSQFDDMTMLCFRWDPKKGS